MKFRLLAATAIFFSGAVIAAIGIQVASGGESPGNAGLYSFMNGAKEVDADGNRNTGDRNGRGTFSATIDGRQLCFGITVKNIDDPVAAHIHPGNSRVAGPVLIPLTHPDDGDPGASSGCVTVTSAQARSIARSPKDFYVNVHTEAFPGGAVRGQLFAKSR